MLQNDTSLTHRRLQEVQKLCLTDRRHTLPGPQHPHQRSCTETLHPIRNWIAHVWPKPWVWENKRRTISPTVILFIPVFSYRSNLSSNHTAIISANVVFPVPGVPVTRILGRRGMLGEICVRERDPWVFWWYFRGNQNIAMNLLFHFSAQGVESEIISVMLSIILLKQTEYRWKNANRSLSKITCHSE